DIVEPLYERILGRVSLHDVYDPLTNELVVAAGEEIDEDKARHIENSAIESVEIRSVLTCESKRGACAKCYGRNLSTGKLVQIGEAVGVIAAQSIGEPGTQLTLRTFHVGGTASNIAAESQIVAKFAGKIEFENVRAVASGSAEGGDTQVVIGRSGELRIVDEKLGKVVMNNNIPYGAQLFVKDGQRLEKGDLICSWDPYNAVMVADFAGKVVFESVLEGVTYREESDEQTGHREKVIIDTRDKTKNPVITVVGKNGEEKSYNIPVGAHIIVGDGEEIKAGQVLVKIPRAAGKTRDITGGLPRVTELFEARNPSNPAVVTEIDGVVTLGGTKRGNREIIIESKDGQTKKYLVPLSKHILVQDNDFVKAGTSLSDGAISPADILA